MQTAVSADNASPAASLGGETGPVLRTEGLTIRFGGLTALNKINLEIKRGEIRAIIGPNGAGKSTFFNCVTGVLRPTSGRILLNGLDATRFSPRSVQREMSIIFQDFGQYQMSVRDNVARRVALSSLRPSIRTKLAMASGSS